MASGNTLTTTADPLPGFEWGDKSTQAFYNALWPHDNIRFLEASVGEPPALRKFIETLSTDDEWLGSNLTEENSMDIDSLDEEGDEAQCGDKNEPARFINLKTHSVLVFEELHNEVVLHGDRATMIVRDEYPLFMEHAISCLRNRGNTLDNQWLVRFFVTGQSGIGKTFGAYYILFYLLASGQLVLFIPSPDVAYFFSAIGVQFTAAKLLPNGAIREALKDSWALIDVGEGDWHPPSILKTARCVVWTSSPREPTMKRFLKYFGAQRWFMKAWTNKEIAAATERFGMTREAIKRRFDTGGPIARSLFDASPPPSPDKYIQNALAGNIFGSGLLNGDGERVFLIQPLAVFDGVSGRVSFQRTDYRAEYLSVHIAHKMFELAQGHLERLQGQLPAAISIHTTRSVAGKLMQAMMHHALIRRTVQLPAVFGTEHIVGTLQLVGKATNFASRPERIEDRPLYLQPESLNFTGVDAIIVTDTKIGLFQTSQYTPNFGMMLRIIARLPGGAKVALHGINEVLYCLIGVDCYRVQALVAEAKRTLEDLQRLDPHQLCEALDMRETNIATHQRLSTFRVIGYTFHYQQGFTSV